MNKPIAIAAAIAFGLPLGYFAREALRPVPDRVSLAITLFENHCVPFARQEKVRLATGLVPLPPDDAGALWADPKGGFAVQFSGNHCVVYDLNQIMSAPERAAFVEAGAMLVQEQFPMLDNSDFVSTEGWDYINGWFEHPLGDPKRWGVLIYRFYADGPESHTTLAVNTGAGYSYAY